MSRVLSVLLLAALPGLAAAQAPARPPIIDMHLHAQNLWAKPGEDAARVFGPVFGERTLGIPTPRSTDELREQTLAAMDRYNIVRAMVGGPHALRYRVVLWGRGMPKRAGFRGRTSGGLPRSLSGSPFFPSPPTVNRDRLSTVAGRAGRAGLDAEI